jgi:hypothetical protein
MLNPFGAQYLWLWREAPWLQATLWLIAGVWASREFWKSSDREALRFAIIGLFIGMASGRLWSHPRSTFPPSDA